jgi:tetratricopeptide (TPR) repeat protein
MSELELLTSTSDDETLRATFNHPEAVTRHVEKLLIKLRTENDLLQKARIHAEIGNFKRGLRELTSAEEHLVAALAIVEDRLEARRQAVVYRIRLANVYHWQEQWKKALETFNLLYEITSRSEFHDLRDYVLQHRGKMHFDQGNFEKALRDFEIALDLRLVKDDHELIESTQQALAAVRRRLTPPLF